MDEKISSAYVKNKAMPYQDLLPKYSPENS